MDGELVAFMASCATPERGVLREQFRPLAFTFRDPYPAPALTTEAAG